MLLRVASTSDVVFSATRLTRAPILRLERFTGIIVFSAGTRERNPEAFDPDDGETLSMKALPKYYVYEIWDPVEGVCRYVGKGHGRRATDQMNPERITNERLRDLVESRSKGGIAIEPKIVYRHNIEADVLRKEIALIAKYGRLGVDARGTLFNITAGGQGIVGRGQPVTVAGITYSTIKEAADAYEVNEYTLRRRLSRGLAPEVAVGLLAKPTPSASAKKVTVGGITYPSQTSACHALGVSDTAVIARLKRGWTVEEAYEVQERNSSYKQTITVDGKRFNSISEAASYFGIKPDTAAARMKRGWTTEEAFLVRKRQRADRPLSESDVIDMRRRCKEERSIKEVAKYYGIDPSTVSRICHGESYADFGGPILTSKTQKKDPLSPEQVHEMRVARNRGATCKELAEKFNIDASSVSNICTGRTYKSVNGPIGAGQRRLTEGEIDAIVNMRERGVSLKEISEVWSLHLETVRRVCSRRAKRPRNGR